MKASISGPLDDFKERWSKTSSSLDHKAGLDVVDIISPRNLEQEGLKKHLEYFLSFLHQLPDFEAALDEELGDEQMQMIDYQRAQAEAAPDLFTKLTSTFHTAAKNSGEFMLGSIFDLLGRLQASAVLSNTEDSMLVFASKSLRTVIEKPAFVVLDTLFKLLNSEQKKAFAGAMVFNEITKWRQQGASAAFDADSTAQLFLDEIMAKTETEQIALFKAMISSEEAVLNFPTGHLPKSFVGDN